MQCSEKRGEKQETTCPYLLHSPSPPDSSCAVEDADAVTPDDVYYCKVLQYYYNCKLLVPTIHRVLSCCASACVSACVGTVLSDSSHVALSLHVDIVPHVSASSCVEIVHVSTVHMSMSPTHRVLTSATWRCRVSVLLRDGILFKIYFVDVVIFWCSRGCRVESLRCCTHVLVWRHLSVARELERRC